MHNVWMTTSLSIWKQWMDIASQSPNIMQKRIELMSTSPWSLGTWIETQQMVWEKWLAGTESLQTMYQLHPMFNMRTGGSPSVNQQLRVINRAMKPVSSRVRGNAKRLKTR